MIIWNTHASFYTVGGVIPSYISVSYTERGDLDAESDITTRTKLQKSHNVLGTSHSRTSRVFLGRPVLIARPLPALLERLHLFSVPY